MGLLRNRASGWIASRRRLASNRFNSQSINHTLAGFQAANINIVKENPSCRRRNCCYPACAFGSPESLTHSFLSAWSVTPGASGTEALRAPMELRKQEELPQQSRCLPMVCIPFPASTLGSKTSEPLKFSLRKERSLL